MSVLSKIFTLVKITLVYIRAFLLHAFGSNHTDQKSSVTPYPLALDLENCIIDIRCDTSEPANTGMDPEQGVFNWASPTAEENIFNQIVNSQTTPPSDAEGPPISRSIDKGQLSKRPKIPPFSNVTNTVPPRTSPHKETLYNSEGENISPTRPQPSRKPTPLRRMPRYLNLTGASPTRSAVASVKKSLGKFRHDSLIHLGNDWAARGCSSPCKSVQVEPSPFTPLKPGAGLAGDSDDLSARIRSAFYPSLPRADDEHENVRDFFNRDSECSGFAPNLAMNLIRDLDRDDEDDYDKSLSVRSTCYSPSKESACADSIPAPILRSSAASELSYLRDNSSPSITCLTTSSSRSSAAFNDLLSSVARKHPGTRWKHIVRFKLPDETESGRVDPDPCGEGIHMNDSNEQWSEVFCLDEYAT
ncbi:hypothetical protein DFH07DRAFT_777320 [Mycena maculata]|uniref:Uncharacterized protein n=1 Tax=Mycena maculata TaxID=230809 RepID=A0AAD7III0_9AGAR|nr:hypothetical protein DFH07DRAFT_777320 [Mycena maculata]